MPNWWPFLNHRTQLSLLRQVDKDGPGQHFFRAWRKGCRWEGSVWGQLRGWDFGKKLGELSQPHCRSWMVIEHPFASKKPSKKKFGNVEKKKSLLSRLWSWLQTIKSPKEVVSKKVFVWRWFQGYSFNWLCSTYFSLRFHPFHVCSTYFFLKVFTHEISQAKASGLGQTMVACTRWAFCCTGGFPGNLQMSSLVCFVGWISFW